VGELGAAEAATRRSYELPLDRPRGHTIPKAFLVDYPFSSGRRAGVPDDNERIQIRLRSG
jgi:hypothetical protein